MILFICLTSLLDLNFQHWIILLISFSQQEIATVEDMDSVDVMVLGAAPCGGNLIQEVQEKLDIQYIRQGHYNNIYIIIHISILIFIK